MIRILKIIIKIILIFLLFYIVVAFIENVFDIEVEPYMIYMMFIIVASSMGWLDYKGKK